MGTRKQDYLLQLIASLSPNEQRYFKLFSNIYPGDKSYLALFDGLKDKEHYDANILKRELNINSKRLKGYKYYLNQMLLRSLGNNAESSSEMLVYRAYLEAYSLLERRLFDYALEYVTKIIDKAKELELFLFLPNLISIKQSCLHGLQRHKEIPTLNEELRYCNLVATELFEITQLRYSVTGAERTRDEKEMLLLFKHPILKKKVKNFKRLKAQMAWFDIMARQVAFFDTPAQFVKLMKLEVEFYEKDQRAKFIDPLIYLNSFQKLAMAEMKAGTPVRALPWLEKLIGILNKPSFPISGEKIRAIKGWAHYNTSRALRSLNRFDEALIQAKKSCGESDKNSPYDYFTFRFEYALVLLHTGHCKETADEINGLLQLNTDMRRDLQLLLRPLLILAQLEMKNTSVIPYLTKSAKAWLKREKKSSPEADVFFHFTYALSKASRAELPKILLEFKTANDQELTGYLGGANIELANWILKQRLKNKRLA